MLFAELPCVERPAAAAKAGFTLVETWWPPDGLADAWGDAVLESALSVCSLNSDAGDIAAGERGFLNLPERRDEVIAAFRVAVALAVRVGAPFVNLPVGRDSGRVSRDEQLRVVADTLAGCCAIAREAGIRILIEAINDLDVPGYLVATPSEAASLIDAVASEELRLLYDAYHVARMGADPWSDVVRFLPLIGHVHYADCPGRGAPGTGTVDVRRFLEALEHGGYAGAVGLEFNPSPLTHETLVEIAHLQPWTPPLATGGRAVR